MPHQFDSPLPIDAVLDELDRTLDRHNAAVLVAPPGAGKTTRVPLALLDEPGVAGRRILVLEPRRIAAARHHDQARPRDDRRFARQPAGDEDRHIPNAGRGSFERFKLR